MSLSITLVSHTQCPYFQRIAIALSEKGVAHERVTVDLANKPGWFLAPTPPAHPDPGKIKGREKHTRVGSSNPPVRLRRRP